MASDDTTAKDLLRQGELSEVRVCGWELVERVYARRSRRPAGSSARLWAKVGVEDPFAEVAPKSDEPVAEARAPAAAARFKQIDKHAKKKKKAQQQNLPGAARKPQMSEQRKAALAAAEEAARKKEKMKRAVARYGEEGAQRMLGLPSATPSADAPGKARPTRTGGPAEDGVDRRPPRVSRGGEGGRSSTGRVRMAGGVDRTPPRVAGPTDGAVDRRPPRVPGPGEAPVAGDEETSRERRPMQVMGPEGKPVDRRPPRVGRAAPQATERRRSRQQGASGDVDRRPPRVGLAANKGPHEQAAPAAKSGGGMDDLFGGMGEGRVRRAPSDASGSRRPTVTAPPEGGVDRSPPRLDRSPPKAAPAANPTPKAPAKPEIDRRPPRVGLAAQLDETPEVERAPPPIDRTPPSAGGASAGGMDDLFGGMNEGRVKRPKQERTGPRRPVVTEAPTGDVDRTPPRLDRPPAPAGEPESAPEPAVDRSPPKVDRTPPRPGGGASGGLDDLFGGMAEGRVKRPTTERTGPRRPVVTEAPTGDVDRTPPRLDRPAAPPSEPESATEPAVDRSPPKVDRTPPRPGGGASGGLDDLFGGMAEGRVKRPKTERSGPRRPVVTEAPAGGVDRTPPRLDRTPPMPAAPAESAPSEPVVDRTPPKVDRTPPRPGGGASSGLDDLLGGMAEGRVKRTKTERSGPRRPVVTEAPTGEVDRTPPRLDRTPPKPAEPSLPAPDAASPPVDRSPPRVDRTPPRPGGGGSGGMDDLFGGMAEGRVRRPKEERKGPRRPVVTEAPVDGVDRTPPRLPKKD
ncbi:MAG: hypothetical protein EP330_08905 [Deltaproteobacteria bacterium]|nr:MAG: hypothetical protein EP330_08905 [Deltaproteobacteria bacterium]